MKTSLCLLVLVSLLNAFPVIACTEDGKNGIVPENTRWIPNDAFTAYAMSEKEFDSAIDKVLKVYSPVLAAQGRTLKAIRNWESGTVNAYANRSGKTSELHLFGGFARHAKITADGFQLVVCHELGHHIAGAPKTKIIFGSASWVTNEGQSDYFATLKCAREVWKNDDNVSIVSALNEKSPIPPLVVEKCQKGFDRAEDLALCERSVIAGRALGEVLADLGSTPAPQFETPDPKVTPRMDDTHPAAQCRLDTYFAGAVCPKAKEEALSDTDPTAGVCSEEKGDALGIRPRCWYLPVGKGDETGGSRWPTLSARQKVLRSK